jgi:thymidylate synthase
MEKKNNLDPQYNNLLKDILKNGIKKQTRNGEVLSVFGRQIRHSMSDGFPLLTGKKMFFKGIVSELIWFLRGDTNVKFLVDNNCHIWNGDAYKRFQKTCQFEKDANHILPDEWVSMSDDFMSSDILSEEEFINKIKTDNEFAKKWGELGPIYGAQWRSWRVGKGVETTLKTEDGQTLWEAGSIYIDQISNLINELKNNPDSRRLMVSAWNVGELDQMILPPCHNLWQMYSVKKEKKRYLSMMVNIRSNDVPLGLPFNIASYALLLEIIAKLVNMVPEDLIINIGDAHIYLNQIEGIKEQLTREPFQLPKLVISDQVYFDGGINEFLSSCLITDFAVGNYQSHPTIKLPLSN